MILNSVVCSTFSGVAGKSNYFCLLIRRLGWIAASLALLGSPAAFAQEAPTANDDDPPEIDEGGSITLSFNVLDNDSDPQGDPLTAELVSGPSNAVPGV